jgi:hypothetical protein
MTYGFLLHYRKSPSFGRVPTNPPRPRISSYDATNKDLKVAAWTGNTWSVQTADSTGDAGEQTSPALDSEGNPHISYDADSGMRYAHWTGSSWAIEVADRYGGEYSSLALDAADTPHIAAYQYVRISGSERLMQDFIHAHKVGAGWEVQTVDGERRAGTYASLALDAAGMPHIACWHEDTRDLYFASGQTSVPRMGYLPLPRK